jgi:hypothetical protein
MDKVNDTMETITSENAFITSSSDNSKKPVGGISQHSSKMNEKDKKVFNPIGLLNEHCQKNKIPPPTYVNKQTEGPDHSPTFNVECIFKNLSFFGQGLSIKEAKEKSALKTVEDLNLKETVHTDKPSFRIVEVCCIKTVGEESVMEEDHSLEGVWDGSYSGFKITIKKKCGSEQQFKTFIFPKADQH